MGAAVQEGLTVTTYEKVKATLLAALTVLAIVVGVFLVQDANAVATTARSINTSTVFINSYIPLIKAEIAAASNGMF